jgi:transcriptional regulator
MFSPELKKGSIELLILTLVSTQPRHGYEIGKQIEQRSGGRLQFRVSSLYPVLCRMEKRGWIAGRWVEQPGQRRRCYYRLTSAGAHALEQQRQRWQEFTAAINLILEASHA